LDAASREANSAEGCFPRASVYLVTHGPQDGVEETVISEGAASLGHERVSTTIESYAKPEAVAGAQQHCALLVLAGGAR